MMAHKDELDKLIRKYALKNAIDYGKADAGSVLGKIIQSSKGVPVPEIRAEVEKIVKEVNGLKRAEIEKEYAPFKAEFEKRAKETVKKTERPKMELEGAEVGNFATRWPPEPSGYQHIGHAKPIFLEDEFRKIYKGKFFLYFDDTNPEKEKQEYVDADKADLAWLGIKFDKEYYASDNMEKIYECARKIIGGGHAYVCHCSQGTIKEMRLAMKECEHRGRPAKANTEEFEKMLSGKYEEGKAVLRFKGRMDSQNTVMRDPIIARIKKDRHYRQGTKYAVWPTYDFAAPINDSVNGVTDVMRSKEYELRDELNKRILELLDMRIPRIHQFSRLNIRGNTTHKREIRELIANGTISGWDDPRLMTLLAIKRRGIVPEAVRQFALRAGMTKTDSELPLESLLAENRRVIDPIAKHLFFVTDPVEVTVKGVNNPVRLRLRPSSKEYREYDVGDKFYVSRTDHDLIKKDHSLRLKDLTDAVLGNKKSRKEQKEDIVQWVSKENYVECSVLVPGELFGRDGAVNPDSLRTVRGYVEKYAEKLKERDIVQFERFGYCILDDKKKMQFIFISK
jgi:glutamyl-tRNA synthetase